MKIKNPKLSVTVGEGANIGQGYYLDSSNRIHFVDTKYESTELVAIKYGDAFAGALFDPDNMRVDDMVNCTAENGGILITDPTKDASCTISVSPLG